MCASLRGRNEVVYLMTRPPSAAMTCPVMKLARRRFSA
jgi:hypothetical protein